MKQSDAARPSLTRRQWLSFGVGALSAGLLAACTGERIMGEILMGRDTAQDAQRKAFAAKGHLAARPSHVETSGDRGLQHVQVEARRDTLLYVPKNYTPERPAPLALMLHGAGGDARHGLSLLQNFADRFGLILVAPASQRTTWDVIASNYGEDVTLIDRALAEIFKRYAVDSKRLAIGGFSDGASYALSLGVTNGDLFSHILAFSPGFMLPTRRQGRPRCFISHGRNDRVLNIDACSRRIVKQAESAGYDVTYREFDGGHTIPPDIAQAAISWFFS